MKMMRRFPDRGAVPPGWIPLLLLMLLCGGGSALAAQSTMGESGGEGALDYRREVFRYPAVGRPDPFRTLIGNTDMSMRIDDLTLRGVIYHPDPGRSVAVIGRAGDDRPVRASLGDRIGEGIRLVAIRPNSVDVVIEEFGITRRETLTLSRGPAIEVTR